MITLPTVLLATAKTKEDRTLLANKFIAARPVLDIYLTHLIKQLQTLDFEAESPENFATPEVSHRLAYQAGQRNALSSMANLLEWVQVKQGS